MSVTYCNVDCQKADWETHKTTCKPCERYIVETVAALHVSEQWRRLIKWRPYLDDLLASMRGTDDLHWFRAHANTQMVQLQHALVEAYKMGIISTGDPDNVYALAAIPLLDEMAELQGKMNLFEDQGTSFCDLAYTKSLILGCDNKETVAYYEKASDVAARHFIPSLQARACFGLGRIAKGHNEYEEAATLLRTAVDSAAETNFDDEVFFVRELVDVLFKLNSVDEAETFIQRIQLLIQRATGSDFKGLTPMHLSYHLLCIRLHEARGKTTEAAREVGKMIALVHENKSSIHDWRPILLGILEEANKTLKILDPKTGNKVLVKSMRDLAHKQRMPMPNFTRDGVEWREILIER
jgi:tetratricopeptide (TPR) repeat protein